MAAHRVPEQHIGRRKPVPDEGVHHRVEIEIEIGEAPDMALAAIGGEALRQVIAE